MYGQLPKNLGFVDVVCKELMRYQYLPVKLAGDLYPVFESRLDPFTSVLAKSICDFIADFGLSEYNKSYVYLTAKHLWVDSHSNMNREGWHCDGFGTSDINYIWSNHFPTIFNTSQFVLSDDDTLSIEEMTKQAKEENNMYFPNCTLVRLDKYNVHCTAPITYGTVRTFAKISISKDKYNLEGNARNYLLDYDWPMLPRQNKRNIPQGNTNDTE